MLFRVAIGVGLGRSSLAQCSSITTTFTAGYQLCIFYYCYFCCWLCFKLSLSRRLVVCVKRCRKFRLCKYVID
jgi:hypothetical protein